MSLLENKQVIHIAVECAVIVVITLYFSIKYKKLHKRVESLSNRLKEQDDIIQNLQKKISNHDKILLNLVSQNQVVRPHFRSSKPQQPQHQAQSQPQAQPQPQDQAQAQPQAQPQAQVPPPVSPEKDNIPAKVTPTVTIEEEIASELEELDEDNEDK